MRRHKDKPLSDDFLEIVGRSFDVEGSIISAVDAQRGVKSSNDMYPGVIKTPSGYRCTRKKVDKKREYANFSNFPEAMIWVLSI